MTIRASNNILISESRKNVDPKENKIVYDHEKVTVSRGHTQVFHCILTETQSSILVKWVLFNFFCFAGP